ncbi:hydroxysteroid 11-beta-dehydrogenase 1-like protein isoform X2 [Apostichopus japonicus]
MGFGGTIGIVTFFGLILAVYFRDTFDPDTIKGKRVVITGSSTGIGEQLAYEYSKLGARVLITARREKVLQEVVSKCKELGATEAFYIPLDMSNKSDTEKLIQEAETRFGGLDHLIMNHIASNYLQLWNGDWDRYQQVMDVNLKAYVSLATSATPLLNKSKGSIAVLSSVAGKIGVPFSALYSCSKFALSGFFNAYRLELGLQEMDISITEFIIGSIDTKNAKEYSKAVFDENIFSTSATDTAHRIMKGTQERERIVYYPAYAFAYTVFRDILPGMTDKLLLASIKTDAVETVSKKP